MGEKGEGRGGEGGGKWGRRGREVGGRGEGTGNGVPPCPPPHKRYNLKSKFVTPKTTVTRNYYTTVIKSDLLSAIKRKHPQLQRSGFCCTMIIGQAIAATL